MNRKSFYKTNKILFLVNSTDFCFLHEIKNRSYDLDSSIKKCSLIFRIIRKLWLKLKFPFYSVWFGNWKKNINKYEIVIIFDSNLNSPIIDWISKKYGNLKLIYWYWNIISNDRNYIDNVNCEKWSFDKHDCKKYKMYYNTSFYFNNIKIESENIIYDVVFIGLAKDRLDVLIELQDDLNKMKLCSYFHIVNDKKYKISSDKRIKFNNYIGYEKIINYISKSKAILDIVQNNQSGLTLRAMESLFFSKKLITNNKEIKNYNFYNEKNIFIIGVDDIKKLKEFINSPYHDIDKKILEYYEFNEWLKRFFTYYNKTEEQVCNL